MLCSRDHVQWTEEETEKARQKAEENSKEKIPVEEQCKDSKLHSVRCKNMPACFLVLMPCCFLSHQLNMTEKVISIGTDFMRCTRGSSSKTEIGSLLNSQSFSLQTPQGCAARNRSRAVGWTHAQSSSLALPVH